MIHYEVLNFYRKRHIATGLTGPFLCGRNTPGARIEHDPIANPISDNQHVCSVCLRKERELVNGLGRAA